MGRLYTVSDFAYKERKCSKRIFGRRKAIAMLLAISLIILSATSLAGCGRAAVDCGELMREFAQSYGTRGKIYFRSAKEGEEGFMREGFLSELFGEEALEYTADFAYLSASGAGEVFECSLFLCNSEYAALEALELCGRRRGLIDSVTDIDIAKNSFIIKNGRFLVFGIAPDGTRAASLWRKIL